MAKDGIQQQLLFSTFKNASSTVATEHYNQEQRTAEQGNFNE